MSILRNKLLRDFTQIPNDIVTDTRLPARARLIYIFLAGKPDGWAVWNDAIMKAVGISDSATMAKYWKALLEAGWITRERSRDEGKIVGGFDYSLNIQPTKNLNEEKSLNTEKSTLRKNTDHNNTDLNNNTKEDNNTTPYTPQTPTVNDRFDAFWKEYPRHTAKAAARVKFAQKLKDSKDPDALMARMLAAIAAQKKTDQWAKDDGKFIPYPATWLNQERWNDELLPAGSPPEAKKPSARPDNFRGMTPEELAEITRVLG